VTATRKTRISDDLLDDSEATLRLVDSLLDDLREGEEIVTTESERMVGTVTELATGPSVLAQLPAVLLRAHTEIKKALESLRQSRGFLERATLERVQRTQENLQAVSNATEKAATDMLDGLDRALLLIDRLDNSADPALAGEGTAAEIEDAGTIRTELRDELFHLISSLQFQDITAQQLRYASGVLQEIEDRLVAIAELFDIGIAELDGAAPTSENTRQETYDASASMTGAEERQALADEIFKAP
jgi:chemotaxis regulatin CheY-phosphate phosphatase CheZ